MRPFLTPSVNCHGNDKFKKAGKSYAEERFLVHKQSVEAREEMVVLNYIMALSGISISCSRKNWNGQKARW